VQDQEECQITAFQQECSTLTANLDIAQVQWKEAEVGWNAQLEDLQQQLT
jgi:hypothetical protein